MKKIIYLLVPVLLLAVVVISLNSFVFNKERYIKECIEEAKYCEKKEDCVRISSQCPFGCWVVVNNNEAERIQSMIHSYDSDCVYGCTELKDYDCIEGKCKIIY